MHGEQKVWPQSILIFGFASRQMAHSADSGGVRVVVAIVVDSAVAGVDLRCSFLFALAFVVASRSSSTVFAYSTNKSSVIGDIIQDSSMSVA